MIDIDLVNERIYLVENEIYRLNFEKNKWEKRNDTHMVGITLHRISFQSGFLNALKWVSEKDSC